MKNDASFSRHSTDRTEQNRTGQTDRQRLTELLYSSIPITLLRSPRRPRLRQRHCHRYHRTQPGTRRLLSHPPTSPLPRAKQQRQLQRRWLRLRRSRRLFLLSLSQPPQVLGHPIPPLLRRPDPRIQTLQLLHLPQTNPSHPRQSPQDQARNRHCWDPLMVYPKSFHGLPKCHCQDQSP